MPAIDVENAWGLDATSYGNHEFDYGVERLLQHQARANFPFLGANIVDDDDRAEPDWVEGTHVFSYGKLRIGVIGIELENTPELVKAGATAGPEVPAGDRDDQDRVREAPHAGRPDPGRPDPRGHARSAPTRSTAAAPMPWDGPDRDDRRGPPGHDGRRDPGRAHPPGLQPDGRRHPGRRGHQRRRQLLGRADGRQRRATSSGPAPRPASPRTSASPSGPTCRRSSTTPTPRRPCCATR